MTIAPRFMMREGEMKEDHIHTKTISTRTESTNNKTSNLLRREMRRWGYQKMVK